MLSPKHCPKSSAAVNVVCCAGLYQSTFPPSLPASLISSCRAASLAHPSDSSTTSADRAGQAVSDHSLSFTSSTSLYDSIPEYFRQHMEPPHDLLPPASQPVPTLHSQPTADISGAHRSLRSASASRKPDRTNSLLDEFAAEELQTLSTLLPASAVPAILPGDERSASPVSPPSGSTLASQPQHPEQFSPESRPRTSGRAGTKQSSSKLHRVSCMLPDVSPCHAYRYRAPYSWCLQSPGSVVRSCQHLCQHHLYTHGTQPSFRSCKGSVKSPVWLASPTQQHRLDSSVLVALRLYGRYMLFCAGFEDLAPEADAMIEDDSSKHVSSTFRGVYKRKFDTKWRAEITAGATIFLIIHWCCPQWLLHKQARQVVADCCCMQINLEYLQVDVVQCL